jgi:probable phosphoglycerate mutase
VVAVGHGIFNKAVLAVYARCAMRDVQRMMNAEVRQLTIDGVVSPVTGSDSPETVAAAE